MKKLLEKELVRIEHELEYLKDYEINVLLNQPENEPLNYFCKRQIRIFEQLEKRLNKIINKRKT